MTARIRFISAGAGSGKTYRVTEDLQEMLAGGGVKPSGVIATTFTRMAANELRERVRQKLMADGHTQLAAQMGQALISTVNGVCGQLLDRFSFEAGLSPEQKILEEEQGKQMFGAALEGLLAEQRSRIPKLNELAYRLGKIDDNYQPNWRGEIMSVASAARANNMAPEQLREWAKTSGDDLLSRFAQPYKSGRDLDKELLAAIDTALASIDTENDSTKATAGYLKFLRDCREALSQGRMQWSDWVKLSKTGPAKKSSSFSEPVQIIAGDFEKNQRLHDDIWQFCADVFDLAADSLEAFQGLKVQQGMLDFVDQERLLYELLDHPRVRDTLAEELQVLFVDEFQDTSPIQLALFMKLAALADQVVWVGDIKQAIYGFRGSDPELMVAVLDGVVESGGVSDVLKNSWRSRPALVDYANEVFVPTFAGTLSPNQVTLEPKRTEKSKATAVACWRLGGSNLARRANDIAFGIQQLIDDGYEVVDKVSRELRLAEHGDIAVLCRTNDRLKGIAEACAVAGIPVAFKRPGLLGTPEGALARASLRRLADQRDTLASAEIRTLALSQSPEDWLAERLQFLRGNVESWKWGEAGDGEIPQLAALAEARRQLAVLTPSEAMELALVKGRVREAVIAWGPTADHTRHRLRNIDMLIEYAGKYEDQCDMLNIAATVPGLILWFNDLANRGEDWQAQASDGRAVTLVTHHGAKGLEWPVVIAVDLDSNIRPRLWNLTVLQREEGFDMNEPLAGRQLRYWPWPFGKQSTGIPVADRIMADEVGVQALAAAVEETRRLLYVSITRARDLLVLPMPSKKLTGEWLGTLAVDWALPHGSQLTLPSGKTIPTSCTDLTAPEGWEIEPKPYEARWVLPGDQDAELLKRNLVPSGAEPSEEFKAGEIIEISERLPLDDVDDVTSLGQALHGVIAAEIASPGVEDRALRILDDWGLTGRVDVKAAHAAARNFVEWAEKQFMPTAWHVEVPMSYELDTGQVARGFVDLLVDTKDGWIIVDHKATQRPRSEWEDLAEGYSGQLATYKEAVEATSGKPVVGTFIHLPVGGAVVELIPTARCARQGK